MKNQFLTLLSVFLLLLNSCNSEKKNEQYYLFSYFTGNGEDGLHLAASMDGLNWKALKSGKSFLTPELGNEKLMRDPCIIIGQDGKFHMVWTVGWREKGIGYASSEDLIHWSEQQYLPVMEHEAGAKNCWAPEITYDRGNEQYLIYWSTTIPGRFPETDSSSEDSNNHRIYYVTTPDFKSFSETKLLYDKGFNVIDASIYFYDEKYFMLLKNENLNPPEKNIRIAYSKHATGPFTDASEPITGNFWAEGPTALKVQDYWLVFFDKYMEGSFGAIRSKDLMQWEDISSQVSFPDGIRHGSAFGVSKRIFNELMSHN